MPDTKPFGPVWQPQTQADILSDISSRMKEDTRPKAKPKFVPPTQKDLLKPRAVTRESSPEEEFRSRVKQPGTLESAVATVNKRLGGLKGDDFSLAQSALFVLQSRSAAKGDDNNFVDVAYDNNFDPRFVESVVQGMKTPQGRAVLQDMVKGYRDKRAIASQAKKNLEANPWANEKGAPAITPEVMGEMFHPKVTDIAGAIGRNIPAGPIAEGFKGFGSQGETEGGKLVNGAADLLSYFSPAGPAKVAADAALIAHQFGQNMAAQPEPDIDPLYKIGMAVGQTGAPILEGMNPMAPKIGNSDKILRWLNIAAMVATPLALSKIHGKIKADPNLVKLGEAVDAGHISPEAADKLAVQHIQEVAKHESPAQPVAQTEAPSQVVNPEVPQRGSVPGQAGQALDAIPTGKPVREATPGLVDDMGKPVQTATAEVPQPAGDSRGLKPLGEVDATPAKPTSKPEPVVKESLTPEMPKDPMAEAMIAHAADLRKQGEKPEPARPTDVADTPSGKSGPKVSEKIADKISKLDARLAEIEAGQRKAKGGTERGSVDLTPEDFESLGIRAYKAVLQGTKTVAEAIEGLGVKLSAAQKKTLTDKVRELDGGEDLNDSHFAEPEPVSRETKPVEDGPTKYGASIAASKDAQTRMEVTVEKPKTKGTSEEQASASYNKEKMLAKMHDEAAKIEKGEKVEITGDEDGFHRGKLAADVEKDYNAARDELQKAYESGEGIAFAEKKYEAAKADVEATILSNYAQGSERGRALASYARAYLDDTSYAGLYKAKTRAVKRKLTTEEAERVQKMADRIAEQDAEIARIKGDAARREAERATAKLNQEAQRTVKKEGIVKTRTEAIERIKTRLMSGGSSRMSADPFGVTGGARAVEILTDIAPDIKLVVKSYLDEAGMSLAQIVSRLQKDIDPSLTDNEIHRILAGEFDEYKPRTESEARRRARDLKKELFDLNPDLVDPAAKRRLEKSIKDLEDGIKAGEFKKKAKPRETPPALEDAMIRRESLRVEAKEMIDTARAAEEWSKMGLGEKIAKEVFNVPRTFVASADLSPPLNQGLFPLIAHPIMSARATGQMLRAAKSAEGYRAVVARLRRTARGGVAGDMWDFANASKLALETGPITDISMDLGVSRLIASPMEVGKVGHKVGLNPFAASARAQGGYLSSLRMELFAKAVNAAESGFMGRPGKKLTLAQGKEIADWVNVMTGHGTNKIAGGLRNINKNVPVFFAPSYMVSRWQLAYGGPKRFVKALKSNPKLAASIIKDYAIVAGVATATLKAAESQGMEVEWNPMSTKWGQIKTPGGTWIDPLGGMLSPVRVVIQAIAGSSREGGYTNPQTLRTFEDYLGGKVSPTVRAGANVFTGKAYGKGFNVLTQEGRNNLGLTMLPIQVQSQLELGKDEELTKVQKAALRLYILLGANVNAPDSEPEDGDSTTGLVPAIREKMGVGN